MKKANKFLAVMLIALLVSLTFSSCGKNENNKVTVVRYLNFKPESTSAYEEIAKKYEEETGNKIIVETAASNTYESTLTSKMSTDEAPTLFQINGPKGYANWKDYCKDLSDTELYKHLTDKSMAVTSEGKVYGIPYVVEGYGIIYNKEITDKYFNLSDRLKDVNSMDEINSFDKLKAVVEDMQKNARELGIKGVFASTSMKAGEDWRWQTHLFNIPVYYEFSKNKIDLASDKTDEIDFEFDEEFKNIYDLYINNSVIDKKLIGTKTVADSMAEFALGECAMVQNGNWAWSQIKDVSGNKVKEENIRFLPIYTGAENEGKQGLCIGTENFYAINAFADEEEQKAAEDFIYWLYSSETGKDFVVNKLGFIAPFDTFKENDTPADPLAKEIVSWMNKDNIETVPWNFTIFPSQIFKENFSSVLLRYAQGNAEWDEVKNKAVDEWKKESRTGQ